MCRLFGFRSFISSQVHSSLVAAENALGAQSNRNPDGWGVAYYVQGAPHLTRSPTLALGDQLFHRLSGVVASQTVLAHVRKATQGPQGALNCHPFQFGPWVFAHNGDIPGFSEQLSVPLRREIAPELRRFVLGETDSETLFHILMTALQAGIQGGSTPTLENVVDAVKRTLERVREVCARQGVASDVLLTFIITNGDILVATQGGKELLFSTHKTSCPDRETCPSFTPACEAPFPGGRVSHLIVSSERLQGQSVWQELAPGDILGVDANMRVAHARLGLSDRASRSS